MLCKTDALLQPAAEAADSSHPVLLLIEQNSKIACIETLTNNAVTRNTNDSNQSYDSGTTKEHSCKRMPVNGTRREMNSEEKEKERIGAKNTSRPGQYIR